MLALVNNLKLRLKLLLGYAITIMFVVVIGLIGFINIQKMNNELNSMHSGLLMQIQGLGSLNTMVESLYGDLQT